VAERVPYLLNAHNTSTLLAALGEGLTIPKACARLVGDDGNRAIHPATVRGWIDRGNRAVEALRGTGVDDPHSAPLEAFPERERRFVQFARQAEAAMHGAGADLIAAAHHAATQPRVTTVRKVYLDSDGNEGRVEITETIAPPDSALALKLAGILDEDYRERRSVEVSGPGGRAIPIEGFTEAQGAALATFTRALLDGVKDMLPARTRQRVEAREAELLTTAFDAITTTPELPPGEP
jgi:hypothetical protein